MGGMKPGKKECQFPQTLEITGARKGTAANKPVEFIPVH
jgi:hypothetical protein